MQRSGDFEHPEIRAREVRVGIDQALQLVEEKARVDQELVPNEWRTTSLLEHGGNERVDVPHRLGPVADLRRREGHGFRRMRTGVSGLLPYQVKLPARSPRV